MNYNESSVIMSNNRMDLLVLCLKYYKLSPIEIFELSLKYKTNNDSNKHLIDLSELIDISAFNRVFKKNNKIVSIWLRGIEETMQSINAINIYYNIELEKLTMQGLLLFFRDKYIKDFNSIEDLIKLNMFELGARGLKSKITSINKINKEFKKIFNNERGTI